MLDLKQAIIKVPIDKKYCFAYCLNIPLNRSPHHRETSQLFNIINHLTSFQVMQATNEGIYLSNRTN